MKRTKMAKFASAAASILAVSVFFPLSAQAANTDSAACDSTMVSGATVKISPTHASVDSSILIDASTTKVWNILTDFEKMADWSSGTLQTISGNFENGGSVVVTFIFGKDDDGKPVTNEIPHTLILEEGKMFGWSDPFPAEIGGGKDNHVYKVVPCGEKTLFVQADEITDNEFAANFANQLLPLYQMFNAELKTAVEN